MEPGSYTAGYSNDRVAKVLDIVALSSSLGNYDSNVIGMAAEIIAEEVFRMTKTLRGSKGIDGRWLRDGSDRSVQVKAWSERRIMRYKGGTLLRLNETLFPDDLLLLLIYSSQPTYEVLYCGSADPFRGVKEIRFDTIPDIDIAQILSTCRLPPAE